MVKSTLLPTMPVVNQLIGIFDPREAGFSPTFALAYIPPAATLFTARANSSGAARLLRQPAGTGAQHPRRHQFFRCAAENQHR